MAYLRRGTAGTKGAQRRRHQVGPAQNSKCFKPDQPSQSQGDSIARPSKQQSTINKQGVGGHSGMQHVLAQHPAHLSCTISTLSNTIQLCEAQPS